MRQFARRLKGGNKALDQLHYRPFIDISCAFTRRAISERLFTIPLGIVDCGAAQGFDPRLEVFDNAIRVVGLEPDEREIDRLRKVYAEWIDCGVLKLICTALWSEAGRRTFYLTRDADSSSFYRPNPNFLGDMPDPDANRIVDELEMMVWPLDQLDLGLTSVDFLKLDVQGAELEALKGSASILEKGVLAVVLETQFTDVYEDQPLFPDVFCFLRNHGFELFDLDIRRWRRRILNEEFDQLRVGQVAYADAVFIRPASTLSKIFPDSSALREQLVKLTCLFEYFSLPDCAELAMEAAERYGVFSAREVESFLKTIRSNKVTAKFDRTVKP